MAVVASGNAGELVTQRTELAHQTVHDAARRPAAEQIRERGVRARAHFSAAR